MKTKINQGMTNQVNNIRYICPQMKVFMVSTRTQILNGSIDGNPSVNELDKGSESYYGFGDNDE